MRSQGHELQSLPIGRDNVITIAKPKMGLYQRQQLAISDDSNKFNGEFVKLGSLLRHCKRALLDMERVDGTQKPFPEDEFKLAYGSPSLWSSWHEMAKFAKYKIESEGFLNAKTDDWGAYAELLREWSQNQGFLHLNDPKFDELTVGKPTERQVTE